MRLERLRVGGAGRCQSGGAALVVLRLGGGGGRGRRGVGVEVVVVEAREEARGELGVVNGLGEGW